VCAQDSNHRWNLGVQPCQQCDWHPGMRSLCDRQLNRASQFIFCRSKWKRLTPMTASSTGSSALRSVYSQAVKGYSAYGTTSFCIMYSSRHSQVDDVFAMSSSSRALLGIVVVGTIIGYNFVIASKNGHLYSEKSELRGICHGYNETLNCK
jgi:hypothetical protein